MAEKYVFLSINDNLTFRGTYVPQKILTKFADFDAMKYRIFASD
jgi:hypothetical protein